MAFSHVNTARGNGKARIYHLAGWLVSLDRLMAILCMCRGVVHQTKEYYVFGCGVGNNRIERTALPLLSGQISRRSSGKTRRHGRAQIRIGIIRRTFDSLTAYQVGGRHPVLLEIKYINFALLWSGFARVGPMFLRGSFLDLLASDKPEEAARNEKTDSKSSDAKAKLMNRVRFADLSGREEIKA